MSHLGAQTSSTSYGICVSLQYLVSLLFHACDEQVWCVLGRSWVMTTRKAHKCSADYAIIPAVVT